MTLALKDCFFISKKSKPEAWHPTVQVTLIAASADALTSAQPIIEAYGGKSRSSLQSGALVVETTGLKLNDAKALLSEQGRLDFREIAPDDPAHDSIQPTSAPGVTFLAPSDLSHTTFIQIQEAASTGVLTALTSDLIQRDTVRLNQSSRGIRVDLRFNPAGSYLMEKVSTRLSMPPQPMAIFLDGDPLRDQGGQIIAPLVQSVLRGEAEFTGLTEIDARKIDAILRSGELPEGIILERATDLPRERAVASPLRRFGAARHTHPTATTPRRT